MFRANCGGWGESSWTMDLDESGHVGSEVWGYVHTCWHKYAGRVVLVPPPHRPCYFHTPPKSGMRANGCGRCFVYLSFASDSRVFPLVIAEKGGAGAVSLRSNAFTALSWVMSSSLLRITPLVEMKVYCVSSGECMHRNHVLIRTLPLQSISATCEPFPWSCAFSLCSKGR